MSEIERPGENDARDVDESRERGELSSAERRRLRADAHALHPVASIGQRGLTQEVLAEVDRALEAHGLIKVRVFSDDRGERENFLSRLCDALHCAPVQHLGKLLILWRAPAERSAKSASDDTRRPPRGKKAAARRAAGHSRMGAQTPAGATGHTRSSSKTRGRAQAKDGASRRPQGGPIDRRSTR